MKTLCAWVAGAAALALASSAAAQPTSPIDREASAARALAGASLFAMSRNAERTWRLLHEARARGDVRGARCVDDTLSRVDVALRTARDDAKDADAAWRAGDAAHARIAMNRVASRLEASMEAERAAEACVARTVDVARSPDRTIVELRIEPALPDGVTDFR